ncbi:MAG: sulfur carrier protein ThiS adenylyltransferase ThiF [Planctomycetia bacterium]|nr:sulfur carrier protein ThiS adenylyltransferase ThiF [Planctomycetia bacterium]
MKFFLTPGQLQKVEMARVGVAGLGGLGSNCVMHLVRSGVRNFVLADMDVVAESNLNRQFFFADQVGMLKVNALEENLSRIVDGLNLETHAVRITHQNALEIFKSCDIIVEAFDAAEEKSFFVHLMLEAGKKVVSASGMGGWGRSNLMQVRSFGENLYVCGDMKTEVSRTAPATSARVGIAAAMQANVVMACLLDMEY